MMNLTEGKTSWFENQLLLMFSLFGPSTMTNLPFSSNFFPIQRKDISVNK